MTGRSSQTPPLFLALLKQEPFGRFDPKHLFGATISAVNLSGVLERLCSGGLSELEAEEAVADLNLRVVAFDEPQARRGAPAAWDPPCRPVAR